MGGAGPDRHDVEWLDDEPSAGRVRRLLGGRLSSRAGKSVVAVLAAAAATVAVVSWPDGTEAQPRDEPSPLSESLARSIEDASGERAERRAVAVWEVTGPVTLDVGPAGVRARFMVVNRGTEPQSPTGLKVKGAFRDAPAVEYRARCRAVGPTAAAEEPISPGGRVAVRCRDVTSDRDDARRLDRRSLRVVAPEPECESEGRRAPF
jgi:hypothetical protein